MVIRNAYPDDINAITEVEKRCFPEAATREEFEKRLKHYGNHFWLMFDEGRLVAFVDGMVKSHRRCEGAGKKRSCSDM